jgi:hypothetical protein
MKPVSLKMLAVLVPALSLCLYAEQTQTITAQTLASQPAGTPYTLNLRPGSVYVVSADVASRVRIGTISLADLAKKLGITGPTLEVAMLGGTRVAKPPAGSVSYAKCTKVNCFCSGSRTGRDCSDLSKSGLCESSAAAEPSPIVCGKLPDGSDGCSCTRATS